MAIMGLNKKTHIINDSFRNRLIGGTYHFFKAKQIRPKHQGISPGPTIHMAQKYGTVTDVLGPACHRPVTKAFDLVRTEVSERANFDILEAPKSPGVVSEWEKFTKKSSKCPFGAMIHLYSMVILHG